MYSVSRFTVSRGTYLQEADRCRPTRHPNANRRQPGGNLFLGSLQIFFPSRCPLVMVRVACCCDSDSRAHCQCHGPTSVRLLVPWSQALRSTLSRVVGSYRNQMGWVGVQSTASGITGVGGWGWTTSVFWIPRRSRGAIASSHTSLAAISISLAENIARGLSSAVSGSRGARE